MSGVRASACRLTLQAAPMHMASGMRRQTFAPAVHRTLATQHAPPTPRRPAPTPAFPAPVYADEPFTFPTKVSEALGVPLFSAPSTSFVRVPSPRQFYGLLRNKIMQAQHRIFLSTLYIGKEERELALYLARALAQRPQLQLTILMDAMRATRESPKSVSSASLLAHLAKMFPDQVDIRLYATPVLRPQSVKSRLIGKRFNEGFGLQHMKVYGFDDDVIISGANLSHDYFVNRSDRYFVIRNHKTIANYLHSLILLVARFSYALQYDGDDELLRHVARHLGEIDDASKDYLQLAESAFQLEWDGGTNLLLAEDTDGSITSAALGPPDELFPEKDWAPIAQRALLEFTQRWNGHAKAQRVSTHDTLVAPLLQMGQLSVTQETDMIPILIDYLAAMCAKPGNERAFSTVDLTSGYFTLSGTYKSLVLSDRVHAAGAFPEHAPAVFRLVAASPESNGFYGSKGLSGRIPGAYTFLEQRFWENVEQRGLQKAIEPPHTDPTDPVMDGPVASVELREWSKYGWTYHNKGIWITPPAQDASFRPTTTLIGSSNYGARSEKLDLECSLLISTTSPHLQSVLADEVLDMRECARKKMDMASFQDSDRKVDWVTRTLTKLVKFML